MLNFCEIVKVFKLQSVPTARYTLLRVEPKIISCFKLGTSTYLQTLYVSANLLEIDFFFLFNVLSFVSGSGRSLWHI